MGHLVWLLMITVAAIGSNSLVLSPILSDVAQDFGASAAEVARASAVYGGATAISALILGRLADRVGGRRALMLGLALLGMAMFASAASGHWVTLALAQGLAGTGAGILLPSAYAMAVRIARPGEDARVLGRVLTGWSVSMVAGVPFSALMTDFFGWRSVFLLLGAMAFAVLLGCRAFPGRTEEGAVATGNSPLAVLRIPTVAPLLLVCLAFMVSFYGVYAFLGDHLRLALGISAGEAGLFVLFYGAGFGLAGFGDFLVDRFGGRRLFPIVMACVSLIYLVMSFAVESLPSILLVSSIWGFVNHFGLNILILLLSRADPNRRSAILGVNSAVTYFGSMIGAVLFGEVYSLGGFLPLTMMAMGLMVIAAVIALLVCAWIGRAGRAIQA